MVVRHNEASPWVQLISDEDEAYYYNERTEETTWEEPAEGVSEFRGKEEDELEMNEVEEMPAAGQLLAEAPQSGLTTSLNPAVADLSLDARASLLPATKLAGHDGGASAAAGVTDQSSRVLELTEENSALKLQVQRLDADAARHAAQTADLQRQVQDHTTALKKAHERETELQGRLAQLQSEHTLLAEQARASESERETARAADAAAHAKEIQELHAQSDYANTQVQRLQTERSEMTKEVTRLESRLAEEIAKAAAAVARSHQNEAASATLDVKVAEAAELREALSQCEALVETHRSKAVAAAAERDTLGAEVAELRSTTAATADLHTAELQNARTQAQVAENAAEEAAQKLSQAIAEKDSAAREVESLRAHLRKGTELIARQQKALDRLGAVGSAAGARSASRGGGRKNASSPSTAAARVTPRRPASGTGRSKQQQDQHRQRRRSKEKQESPTSRTRSKTPTSAVQKSAGSGSSGLTMFAREEERRKKKEEREKEKRDAMKLAEIEGCTFKPDLSVSARKKKPGSHSRSGSVGRGPRSGVRSGTSERDDSDNRRASTIDESAVASSRSTGSPESRAPLGGKLIAGETEWRTYEPTDRS